MAQDLDFFFQKNFFHYGSGLKFFYFFTMAQDQDLEFFAKNFPTIAQDLDFFHFFFTMVQNLDFFIFFFTMAQDLDFSGFNFFFHYGSGLRFFFVSIFFVTMAQDLYRFFWFQKFLFSLWLTT